MSKLAQDTFFKRIEIYLVKGKNNFARLSPPPYKKSLVNLQIKPFQIIANSAQVSANSLPSFIATPKIMQLNATQFSPEEKIIDDFFSDIRFKPVKDELNKWFFFGLSGNSGQIVNLSPDQLEHFKTALPLLISALYNYHRSTRQEASSGT